MSLCGYLCQWGCGGAVLDEVGKYCGVGDIGSLFYGGCAAGCASPSGGAFAGGAFAFHVCTAVAAWSVLWHEIYDTITAYHIMGPTLVMCRWWP